MKDGVAERSERKPRRGTPEKPVTYGKTYRTNGSPSNYMKSQRAERAIEERVIGKRLDAGLLYHKFPQQFSAERRRIALLTPYSGGNLGDAAIQDAVIANLRLRLPNAQFSGLTLNDDNFMRRHGTGAFPLYASRRPFYRWPRQSVADPWHAESCAGPARTRHLVLSALKQLLSRTPGLGSCLKAIYSFASRAYGEFLHSVRGYRFLRMHHLLIVSGGGQLDEEWGGPWGHPFALFKWAVLARIARVPYAIASVGACKLDSVGCRLFLAAALRLAQYRSYRDKNSREAAKRLLRGAALDPVVPDMAFTVSPPAEIQSISRDRLVIAVSPIAYARPGSWAHENTALYDRYLKEMANVILQLLRQGHFLAIACSSLGDDDRVVPEILERLDDEAKQRFAQQLHIPTITSWKDFTALLMDVDFLIASRLHSTILAFVVGTPTIAISFDPKVDWVMEDLGQTDYLLHISDFRAADVVEALHRLQIRRDTAVKQIASYLQSIPSASKLQYDTLAKLALNWERRRS